MGLFSEIAFKAQAFDLGWGVAPLELLERIFKAQGAEIFQHRSKACGKWHR